MVPLVVRSGHSLMWGAAGIDALCRHARALGYERLALTDTDNLYGLWPFLSACCREGLRPIIGTEVTDPATPRRAVCLVKTQEGYGRLCRLITRRRTDPDFNLETALPPLAEGLVVLSDHPELLTAFHEKGLDVAAAMARHPVFPGHPLRRTALRLGVPVAAVPDSFFCRPEEWAVHRVLRAIDRNTCLSWLSPGSTAPADAFLAPPRVYQTRFETCPEAIAATHAISERLAFTRPDFGIVLPPDATGERTPAAARLREAAYAGAVRRYGELSEAVVERLEHELAVITQMGFAAYFLIVAEIVSESPRTCGRGSGAASLVAYCLGITNVCPVRHQLYFERFLNPGRTDPPDIDVDFAWDERDGVIEKVLSRYRGHAAMVASHVCFQPRMAIREVAKVFGLAGGEIDAMAGRLPWFRHAASAAPGLEAGLRETPQLAHADFPAPWPEILSMAERIMGLPRHLSVHPGGVVITPEPMDTYVPVERAAKGVPVMQWDKDAAEAAGLVKIDLLGNRSLGVIRDAVAGIRENGVVFDEDRWDPEQDPATRKAVAEGRTMGCFYIESPAMRLLQQKAGVGDFEHLVIHSSIIRPAANEVIEAYIRRLHGGAWAPIHPLLEEVLEETLGLMVYQEDVSRVAVVVAGFSHADADRLRKILSKKDRERSLADYRERFAAGAREKGLGEKEIQDIWRMIMSFNGYSFCKPHSASYARVSFQAAYLKTHFPAEFMAAVIGNQGGFYSTFAYVSEARRLGVTLLPPDVTRSRIRWRGKGGRLRVGLQAIGGLSGAAMSHIAAEREKAPFSSLFDFLDRVRPDETEVRALVRSGALDRFHLEGHRAALMWQWACWRDRRDRDTPCLFGSSAPPAAPPLPPDDPLTRLRGEFHTLGFLCDRHPMTLFEDSLRSVCRVKAAALAAHRNRRVRIAGWLITGKTVTARTGDPMQFITFEDETGLVEAVFFPDAYRRFCRILEHGRPYLVSGKVEMAWGVATLTVDGVRPLKAASVQNGHGVKRRAA